ncbi:MAG: 50S ribosomal protein L18e [Candidatus Woesearchaeota archaeon]
MKRGPINPHLCELIRKLKATSIDEKVNIWKRVAEDLEKPARNKRAVNIARINRNTKEGEMIVVPGKVLGTGTIGHKLTIAAFAVSDSARKEIEKADGKVLTINELLAENPKGKNLRIIG